MNYEDKLAELQALVSDMDGLDRAMADDLLQAYVRLLGDVQELSAKLEADGLIMECERGCATNRHIELVKNPAFDMRHKATSQLADLAMKIRKFVTLARKEGPSEDEEPDEFTAFLAS